MWCVGLNPTHPLHYKMFSKTHFIERGHISLAIKTQKRNKFNIDELQAYRHAYGGKLQTSDYMMYAGAPALVMGVFSFLLLYNVWVSIPMALFGLLYGLMFLMPKAIQKQYETLSFNQRNKFINNITQALSDEGQTVTMALRKVRVRADGEFEEDLYSFYAKLVGADNMMVREAAQWFSDKYDDDVIFVQYIDQLVTAVIEGKNNVDTLKDVKTHHNEIRGKQEDYELVKAGHLRSMKFLVFVMVILMLSLSISFGFNTYLEAFARHWTGYVTSGVYMMTITYFMFRFSVFLFDDSVTEITR